jgi:transcriptional regulator with XRE-family HTH domain
MSQTNKTIGEYIRELRTNRGIPLRKLAFALDIDQSTLAKMEKGQRPFSLSMTPIIAKALEIDFKELQIALVASKVLEEVGDEEFVSEGLKLAVKRLNKNRSKVFKLEKKAIVCQ